MKHLNFLMNPESLTEAVNAAKAKCTEPTTVRPFKLPDLVLTPADYMHMHRFAVQAYEAADSSLRSIQMAESDLNRVRLHAMAVLEEIENRLREYQLKGDLENPVKYRLWACPRCKTREDRGADDLCVACEYGL